MVFGPQGDADDRLIESLPMTQAKGTESLEMILDLDGVLVLHHIPSRASRLASLSRPPLMRVENKQPIAGVNPWSVCPMIHL